MPSSRTLTAEQIQAVQSTGRSVVVSAAAGSGKTTVLAERCAYLVCDAPPGIRCDVDALLVLTFTDAAAAEMKSRIVEAIRGRAESHPADLRLQQQLQLADAAQISTIHSFCLWMIRRWFSRLGIDPTATVLDGDETTLLKKDVLSELFERLYALTPTAGNPLGADRLGGNEAEVPFSESAITHWRSLRRRSVELGALFARLVEIYGLGDDREIAAFLLRLDSFTRSLVDPVSWLTQAVDGLGHPEGAIEALAGELPTELDWQMEHCAALAEAIERGEESTHYYAGRIREYGQTLTDWRHGLETFEGSARQKLDHFRERIATFDFGGGRAPNLPKTAPESAKRARELVGPLFNKDVKKKLFEERLRCRFGLFSVEEWEKGMLQVAPMAAMVVHLQEMFAEEYAARKRRMNVLDFADLERLAFELLRDGQSEAGSEVAISLRRRFAHVLVDEFQDINPLQQAILGLVSREPDSGRDANLFVVGDVKQSIYRFRLAEPEIFLERLKNFRGGPDDPNRAAGRGCALFLQSNFRSRPEILEAVNFLFERLMQSGAGGVSYDEHARLRAGKPHDPAVAQTPVEIHLLERHLRAASTEEAADEESESDDEPSENGSGSGICDVGGFPLTEVARWDSIEREAFWIGTKIRELVSPSLAGQDGGCFQYRDVAVLLRATKVNADRMAAMFAAMGIPAHAEVGGSLFAALEVRDLLALLQLLDNAQQDIPLAAVLRSGILSIRFTEDELAEMRMIDREIPFHAAVRAYASRGDMESLRQRLGQFFVRLRRYRNDAHRRPLADTLWSVYEREGFMAHVLGLPNGRQRRANLLKLHDLARGFGSFRRQGLHRFLRFIESMANEDREVGVAQPIGEADDVVRILSIHQAKGLEFPVVFVAGLGTKFNLGDRKGRIIFERKAKIGLRVVDLGRMIEYPSLVHQLAAAEVERSTRDEELRILYVAMTRAKERLFLVGSLDHVDRLKDSGGAAPRPLTRLAIASAQTPLDWLIPAVRGAPGGAIAGLDETFAERPIMAVALHNSAEMSDWRPAQPMAGRSREGLECVAGLGPLPGDEPRAPHDDEVERLLTRVQRVYPWLSASSVRATLAASEAKTYQIEEAPAPAMAISAPQRGESDFHVDRARQSAAERGIIIHRCLQHLDFEKTPDAAGVAAELDRMMESAILTAPQRELVPLDALSWFVTTPLAAAIRSAGGKYRREFRFLTAEPLTSFDPTVTAPADDRVLVRGIIDGILITADGLEIIDFKTDAVAESGIPSRCEAYRGQIAQYARAVERLWRRPVVCGWLVFLSAKTVVRVEQAMMGMDR